MHRGALFSRPPPPGPVIAPPLAPFCNPRTPQRPPRPPPPRPPRRGPPGPRTRLPRPPQPQQQVPQPFRRKRAVVLRVGVLRLRPEVGQPLLDVFPRQDRQVNAVIAVLVVERRLARVLEARR